MDSRHQENQVRPEKKHFGNQWVLLFVQSFLGLNSLSQFQLLKVSFSSHLSLFMVFRTLRHLLLNKRLYHTDGKTQEKSRITQNSGDSCHQLFFMEMLIILLLTLFHNFSWVTESNMGLEFTDSLLYTLPLESEECFYLLSCALNHLLSEPPLLFLALWGITSHICSLIGNTWEEKSQVKDHTYFSLLSLSAW